METKKYQLPKGLAQKWLTALRSGDFKQATGCFTRGKDCFCALGLGYFVGGAIPTKSVMGKGWSLDGTEPLDDYMYPLFDEITSMNDRGVKFPKIANWIETNVEFVEN